MCHEQWWAQRRARAAKESQEIWLDFERTGAAVDRPTSEAVPNEQPDVTWLDSQDAPAVAER